MPTPAQKRRLAKQAQARMERFGPLGPPKPVDSLIDTKTGNGPHAKPAPTYNDSEKMEIAMEHQPNSTHVEPASNHEDPDEMSFMEDQPTVFKPDTTQIIKDHGISVRRVGFKNENESRSFTKDSQPYAVRYSYGAQLPTSPEHLQPKQPVAPSLRPGYPTPPFNKNVPSIEELRQETPEDKIMVTRQMEIDMAMTGKNTMQTYGRPPADVRATYKTEYSHQKMHPANIGATSPVTHDIWEHGQTDAEGRPISIMSTHVMHNANYDDPWARANPKEVENMKKRLEKWVYGPENPYVAGITRGLGTSYVQNSVLAQNSNAAKGNIQAQQTGYTHPNLPAQAKSSQINVPTQSTLPVHSSSSVRPDVSTQGNFPVYGYSSAQPNVSAQFGSSAQSNVSAQFASSVQPNVAAQISPFAQTNSFAQMNTPVHISPPIQSNTYSQSYVPTQHNVSTAPYAPSWSRVGQKKKKESEVPVAPPLIGKKRKLASDGRDNEEKDVLVLERQRSPRWRVHRAKQLFEAICDRLRNFGWRVYRISQTVARVSRRIVPPSKRQKVRHFPEDSEEKPGAPTNSVPVQYASTLYCPDVPMEDLAVITSPTSVPPQEHATQPVSTSSSSAQPPASSSPVQPSASSSPVQLSASSSSVQPSASSSSAQPSASSSSAQQRASHNPPANSASRRSSSKPIQKVPVKTTIRNAVYRMRNKIDEDLDQKELDNPHAKAIRARMLKKSLHIEKDSASVQKLKKKCNGRKTPPEKPQTPPDEYMGAPKAKIDLSLQLTRPPDLFELVMEAWSEEQSAKKKHNEASAKLAASELSPVFDEYSWLAPKDLEGLAEEFKTLLEDPAVKARVLRRMASYRRPMPKECAKPTLEEDSKPAKTGNQVLPPPITLAPPSERSPQRPPIKPAAPKQGLPAATLGKDEPLGEFRELAESLEQPAPKEPLAPLTPPKLVAPLSQEKEEKVHHALYATNPNATVGEGVTRKDIGTIMPSASYDRQNGWLNDVVIESYLSLVVQEATAGLTPDETAAAAKDPTPPFHVFNPALMKSVKEKGVQSVARWARRARLGGEKLLKARAIFVPVNLTSSHWSLLLVLPQQRQIHSLDSLAPGGDQLAIKLAKDWLKMELGAKYVAGEWKILRESSTQQTNGKDCGVFTCINALAFVRGTPYGGVQAEDMEMARKMMVAALISGEL